MPKPVPVYIVPRPRFRDQLLAGLLVIGIAAFVLKVVVIMALWAAALFVVAAIARNWPRPFFSTLFVGGVYLFPSSPGLTVGWMIVSLAILTWLGAKRSRI